MSPLEDLRLMARHQGRWVVVALLYAVAAIAFLVGAFIYTWSQEPGLPEILGPYPEQTVNLPRYAAVADGVLRPTLRYPAEAVVPVTSEKCVKADVSITGYTSWQPVMPADSALIVSRGATERVLGCVTATYDNRVPPEVASYLTALHLDGVDVSVWRITGTETPTEPPGLPHTWRTEEFTIIYGEAS